MAYDILTMAPPQVQERRGGEDYSANVSEALAGIQATLSKAGQDASIKKAQSDQRAATADIIQGSIDPDRAQNEMFYSATITRNTVNSEFEKLMTDLDDPNSEVSGLAPEDFTKYIQDQAKMFNKNNKGSKFSEVNGDIFNQFLLANQPKAIAKHAANYKEQLKSAQSSEALTALSTITHNMDPEHFDLSVRTLIDMSLPSKQFTTIEREGMVMAAAMNAARNGDGRLLKYAERSFDGSNKYPKESAVAKRDLRIADKEAQRSHWDNQYAIYEEKATNGQFTQDDWNMLIRNGQAIDNLGGRSKIDSWLGQSAKAANKASALKGHYKNFIAGIPMLNATPDDINKVIETFSIESGNATPESINRMSMLLSKQNVVSTDLKTSLNSALGRQVWTPEVANSEQFQTAFTVADSMSEHMSNDQLQRQLGEDAFDTYSFISDFMEFNGGNFQDAVAAMASATQGRKKHGLEMRLSSKEYEQMAVALDDVFEGNVETSDPNMNGFLGWTSKAENAIFTGGVRADISRQAELLILQGWKPEKAILQATRKIAANYQEFGGEMHFTGGASVGQLFGFSEGTAPGALESGYEFYVNQMGKEPEDTAIQLVGGNIVLTDKETGASLPPVPASVIGDMWKAKTLREIADQEAESEEEQNAINQETTDMFNQILYNTYGTHNGKAEFIDGVSIEKFERASLEDKMKYYKTWRYEFEQGSRRFAKVLTTAGDWWANAGKSVMSWLDKEANMDAAVFPGEDPMAPGITSEVPEQTQGAGAADAISPEDVGEAEEPAQPGKPNATEYYTELKKYAKPWTPATHKKHEIAGVDKAGNSIEAVLSEHEGAVGVPYLDGAGIMTIGIGHNLEANPFDAEETKKFGRHRNWDSDPMTKDEALWLLDRDINRVKEQAPNIYPSFEGASKNRQDGIAMLMFNMGPELKGASTGMPGAFEALKDGRWDDAANELKFDNGKSGKLTQWYKSDVKPKRGDYIINLIRKG